MRAPGRILFLVNALIDDAPTVMTLAIAEEMERRGWAVSVVAWKRAAETAFQNHGSSKKGQVLGKEMISGAIALRRIVEQFAPDILHTALVRPALGITLARLVGLRKSFRWVAGDHGVHEWYEHGALPGYGMKWMMPAILTQADRVVTVSDSAATDLRMSGVRADPICVVSNGVDVRRFYPGPRWDRRSFLEELFPGVPDQVFLIGSAGNLRWIKGHDILIRAMEEVVKEVPDARLVIFGAGPEEPQLKALARHLNLDEHITFAGHEANMDKRMPLLDLYVQPSRVESFGLAAAEAMACGVPTVVSSAGGLPELADGDKYAIRFDGGSDDLAAKIIGLYKDRRGRTRLGDKGRLRILQRYTRQRMVERMADLYEVINRSG